MVTTEGGSSSSSSTVITNMSNQQQKKPEAGAPSSSSSMEYQLKKYLLLLATLVATVTYATGLNPPGGSWPEDDASAGRLAGDSILRDTNYMRYLVFYCFNAISFAASLVVSLLLLLLHRGDQQRRLLKLTRAVMVIDLLALMGAYAAGGSHDRFTTVCASVLVAAASAYVILVVPNMSTAAANKDTGAAQPSSSDSAEDDDKEEHEILLLLAIFVATVAYVAGMNPPGGFWRSTQQGHGHHVAGNPVLQGLHPVRYKFFFFSNTAAFIASLLAITITVHYEKLNDITKRPITLLKVALYGLVVTAILGLGGAYAAGSCRDSKHTIYVLCLVVPVLVCVFLQSVLVGSHGHGFKLPCFGTSAKDTAKYDDLDKTREFIQLLAILAATITYQAGLDPPGGVWAEGEAGGGHRVGDPILLTTHPVRYMVFFYFNSGALVASLVIMVILQNEFLVKRHALEATMILDLFGLMGAYAAGSCRVTSTSIYTVALAGGVLIYVVIHIVFFTLDPAASGGGKKQQAAAAGEDQESAAAARDERTEKKREVLLLLAILAATLTYQAGLTPPGGFWEKDEAGHSAGDPVLQDMYPRRYKAFFYCNAASFMASVALIVLLLNPNLYRPGIRCYALFVCMVAGVFGLIGAYAAGSSLHLRTSIIVLVLVTAVFAAVVYVAYIRGRQPPKTTTFKEGETTKQHQPPKTNSKEPDMMAKYLMLVGILAASVTYLTGLKPPGGLWRDDGGGHDAGNPVLYDTEKHRYNAFFYSNSTSFMASVTVIALLLSRMIRDSAKPLWPMHTAMLLDMLTLLGAYTAGSARDWGTSKNVILLLFPVLGFVVLLFFWKKGGDERKKLEQDQLTAQTK